MFLVCTANLNSVRARLARNIQLSETNIADISRDLVAHVLVHDWLETNQLALAFAVNPHIFDDHIFQSHFLSRLEQKGGHGEMDDVQVPQCDPAHKWRSALVTQ